MKYHIYKWGRKFDENRDYEDTWTYQGVQDLIFTMARDTSGSIDGDRFHSIYSIKHKENYMEIDGFLIDNHTPHNIRCYTEKQKEDIIKD